MTSALAEENRSLRAQVAALTRQVQGLQRDAATRSAALVDEDVLAEIADSAPDAIQAVLAQLALGKSAPLHRCRSLDAKLSLLRAAMAAGPELLLPVLLFLKDSLTPFLLVKHIRSSELCCSMLSAHLEREDASDPVLAPLYHAQGRHREAALLRLRIAYAERDPAERLHQLRRCVPLFRQYQPLLAFELKSLTAHTELLARQLRIEETDAAMALTQAQAQGQAPAAASGEQKDPTFVQ